MNEAGGPRIPIRWAFIRIALAVKASIFHTVH